MFFFNAWRLTGVYLNVVKGRDMELPYLVILLGLKQCLVLDLLLFVRVGRFVVSVIRGFLQHQLKFIPPPWTPVLDVMDTLTHGS